MDNSNTDLNLSPRDPTGPAPAPKSRRSWWPMTLLALVIVAGGFIVTQFLSSAVDYYCNVDEVGTRSGCDPDRRIRLQGTVDEGSLDTIAQNTVFSISFNGKTMPVIYNGAPGGIFKECIPVVVHGVINNGRLRGDRVEVKHSDEYIAVTDDRVADAQATACNPGTESP